MMVLLRFIPRADSSGQSANFVQYVMSTTDWFVWSHTQTVTAFGSFTSVTGTEMFPNSANGRITMNSSFSLEVTVYKVKM